jgi:hypothetical protein
MLELPQLKKPRVILNVCTKNRPDRVNINVNNNFMQAGQCNTMGSIFHYIYFEVKIQVMMVTIVRAEVHIFGHIIYTVKVLLCNHKHIHLSVLAYQGRLSETGAATSHNDLCLHSVQPHVSQHVKRKGAF